MHFDAREAQQFVGSEIEIISDTEIAVIAASAAGVEQRKALYGLLLCSSRQAFYKDTYLER